MNWGYFNPVTKESVTGFSTREDAQEACITKAYTDGVATSGKSTFWREETLNREFIVFAVTDQIDIDSDSAPYPVNVSTPELENYTSYPRDEITQDILRFAGTMIARAHRTGFDELPGWREEKHVPQDVLIQHFVEQLFNVRHDPAPFAELGVRLARLAERLPWAYPTIIRDYVFRDESLEKMYGEKEQREVKQFAHHMIRCARNCDKTYYRDKETKAPLNYMQDPDGVSHAALWDAFMDALQWEAEDGEDGKMQFKYVHAAILLMWLRDKEIRMGMYAEETK